jgi:ribose 1,5-bisphosphokinase PhnN
MPDDPNKKSPQDRNRESQQEQEKRYQREKESSQGSSDRKPIQREGGSDQEGNRIQEAEKRERKA